MQGGPAAPTRDVDVAHLGVWEGVGSRGHARRLPSDGHRRQVCPLAKRPCRQWRSRGVGVVSEVTKGRASGIGQPRLGTGPCVGHRTAVDAVPNRSVDRGPVKFGDELASRCGQGQRKRVAGQRFAVRVVGVEWVVERADAVVPRSSFESERRGAGQDGDRFELWSVQRRQKSGTARRC